MQKKKEDAAEAVRVLQLEMQLHTLHSLFHNCRRFVLACLCLSMPVAIAALLRFVN